MRFWQSTIGICTLCYDEVLVTKENTEVRYITKIIGGKKHVADDRTFVRNTKGHTSSF
jgi:hypothetical protein